MKLGISYHSETLLEAPSWSTQVQVPATPFIPLAGSVHPLRHQVVGNVLRTLPPKWETQIESPGPDFVLDQARLVKPLEE